MIDGNAGPKCQLEHAIDHMVRFGFGVQSQEENANFVDLLFVRKGPGMHTHT